jgi:hypothetical protein
LTDTLKFRTVGYYLTNLINNPSSLKLQSGYGFLFRSEIFFRTTQELEYFFLLQNLTLGYMTKTLNQIIFFFLHQNQNIFFSNIGNQNIFIRKKTQSRNVHIASAVKIITNQYNQYNQLYLVLC